MRPRKELEKEKALMTVTNRPDMMMGFLMDKVYKGKQITFVIGFNEQGMEHVSICAGDLWKAPEDVPMIRMRDYFFLPDEKLKMQLQTNRIGNGSGAIFHMWHRIDVENDSAGGRPC